MRVITTHHTNDANKAIGLHADDRNPENGNASHQYLMYHPYEGGHSEKCQQLDFQNGPIGEVGINGITNEVLLAIVIDRLEGFQSSKYACVENANALGCLDRALAELESRTKKREARGVEGTHQL
jgi:hypothetical protein